MVDKCYNYNTGFDCCYRPGQGLPAKRLQQTIPSSAIQLYTNEVPPQNSSYIFRTLRFVKHDELSDHKKEEINRS